MTFTTRWGSAAADSNTMAQGFALFNIAFAGAQLLGPVAGSLAMDRFGWGGMTLVLGLLCFVTALPVGFYPKEVLAGQKNDLEPVQHQ